MGYQHANKLPDAGEIERCSGERLEKAYWQSRMLAGRNITTTDVLEKYRQDSNSLRAGLFVQKLCLKKRLHQGRPVDPEHVVAELKRAHDSGGKCLLAIALFTKTCCLRDLRLHNQPIATDQVARQLQAVGASLELARFKRQCCLEGRWLNGRPVMPEAVLEAMYNSQETPLSIAHFMADCYQMDVPLNGHPISPEAVIDCFPDSHAGHLGSTRFQEKCLLANVPVHGKAVSPEKVQDSYKSLGMNLELARFKSRCFLNGLRLNGEPVTAAMALQAFPTDRSGRLGILRFKEECLLNSLLIQGQKVSPEEVVAGYRKSGHMLEMARFKESCCLKDLRVSGRVVTPDEVVSDFEAIDAFFEAAYFKQKCCLANRWLMGRKISPDSVVGQFPDTQEGRLGRAQFKSECCLSGLKLFGQQISPAEVISAYRAACAGRELIKFLIRCCLSGLQVDGQTITPAVVIGHNQAVTALTDLACFKEQCCLMGLRLNHQLIAPQEVLDSFRSARASVEMARFRGECFLRGLHVHGRALVAEDIVNKYPRGYRGQLCLTRFKQECCLKGHLLSGRKVPPEEVVASYQSIGATLELARFKEECCLAGLHLDGQPVSPETVLKALTGAHAMRELVRFKEFCCLKGLSINGCKVLPETVLDEYEQGGWLLDKAIFYSRLALHTLTPHNTHLSNARVLQAFDNAPGDNANKQVKFLIQQLHAQSGHGYCDVLQKTFQQAWQIVHHTSVNNDRTTLQQCILRFMAMQYDLTVAGQYLTPEQVIESIKALRDSFRKTRLLFFFLAHCYQAGLKLNGQPVHRQQVIDCLEALPQSRLRFALTCWFGPNATTQPLDELMRSRAGTRQSLLDAVSADPPEVEERAPRKVEVFIDRLGDPYRVVAYFGQSPVASAAPRSNNAWLGQLGALSRRALAVVQNIDGLWITGSFSRCLQGINDSFNDVDLIGTETAIKTLLEQLTSNLNSNGSGTPAEIPSHVIARRIPGCSLLKLPTTFDITLTEGDLGSKVGALQANIYSEPAMNQMDTVRALIPGVIGPLTCLSLSAEMTLMNATLNYLLEHLDELTARLQKEANIDIPRTILFNIPANARERIYGLLMRCLLSINKARQLQALTSDDVGPPLVAKLLAKLQSHPDSQTFVHTLEQWLASNDEGGQHRGGKWTFINTLLGIMNTFDDEPGAAPARC